ncbi:hypothetical protein Vadar_022056 [Vaccinium darrowii]|uniref:Uncharacterized protein n=1 Tax=Vaccinium darrowii TaxID=229202 RepID=A0ACB7XBV4_9ERIC|nr:hypothetical protein Vadar_022056 [Vaccinium darrowii]
MMCTTTAERRRRSTTEDRTTTTALQHRRAPPPQREEEDQRQTQLDIMRASEKDRWPPKRGIMILCSNSVVVIVDKVDTLQVKPSEMPCKKEELLYAAICHVDALEAELIAT